MPRRTKAAVKKDKLFIFIEWLAARPLLTELTLISITVLFGMQVLRVLIPSISWHLDQPWVWQFGQATVWGAMQLGIIIGIIFLTGFLSGPLSWLIGNRRLMAATAAGLGLMRLFMQVPWEEPLLTLSLAILGAILFVIFLPACFEDARLRGGPATSRYALGLLGGLALDTAINGAFNTYDTVWQMTPLPVLLTLLLLIIQLVLIMGITPTMIAPKKSSATKVKGTSMVRPFTWLAIGPFLFLELVIFQNIPRLATLTGWTLSTAFGLTLLAQLASIAIVAWLLSKSWQMLWLWALGAGVILTATLVFAYQEPAALIALLFLIGQVLVSTLIAMVLIGITTSKGKTKHSFLWIANGLGIAIFLGLIFAYHVVYRVGFPYNNVILEPIAGGIIAACAIGALIINQHEIQVDPKLWLVPIIALILLALPLAQMIIWRTPTAVTGESYPVRVMTYNLNNGFNTKGKLDIEEVAQVIENSNADIIALQEVSRGLLINGRLDMLEWLSQRLHMPYVFGPTVNQFYGNAIMSRYPIVAYSKQDLPSSEPLKQSGFILTLIDIGENENLKIITTDLHNHIEQVSETRQLQAKTIANFLDSISHDRIILLGSINAHSDDPEIRTLRLAHLKDEAAIMDPNLAYTFASDNPHQRIDYIWTSYDLTATEVQVPLSTASDHLPVFAVIYE